MIAPIAESPSTATLGGNRPFVLFWWGESASLLGTEIAGLLLPLLALDAYHASALELGLLNTARFLPWLVLTMFVGAWVDRTRGRPLILLAYSGRTLTLGTLAALLWLGLLPFGVLLVLVLAYGSLTVVFEVASFPFLLALVRREQVISANARLAASSSIAGVLGPGLAGLLVGGLGVVNTLGVNATLFFVGVITMSSVRPDERPGIATPRALLTEIWEGFRICFGSRAVRAIAAISTNYNFGWSGVMTLFVVYAVRDLAMPSSLIGGVFLAGGLGAILGSVAAGPAAARLGLGRALLPAMIVGGSGYLLLLPAREPGIASVAWSAAALFLGGFGSTFAAIHMTSIRQAVTPHALLGRANASYRTINYGAIPLGALTAGILGESTSVAEALAIFCAVTALCWTWVFTSDIPRWRAIPEP